MRVGNIEVKDRSVSKIMQHENKSSRGFVEEGMGKWTMVGKIFAGHEELFERALSLLSHQQPLAFEALLSGCKNLLFVLPGSFPNGPRPCFFYLRNAILI